MLVCLHEFPRNKVSPFSKVFDHESVSILFFLSLCISYLYFWSKWKKGRKKEYCTTSYITSQATLGASVISCEFDMEKDNNSGETREHLVLSFWGRQWRALELSPAGRHHNAASTKHTSGDAFWTTGLYTLSTAFKRTLFFQVLRLLWAKEHEWSAPNGVVKCPASLELIWPPTP